MARMQIFSTTVFLGAMTLLACGATGPASLPATAPTAMQTTPTMPAPAGSDGFTPDASPELDLFKEMPVVVVAAAKHEQAASVAPASVSVVTASDIELFNYQNLAEVLRDQRSFYLETDGLNWFAGVRGFSRAGEWNSRISVLVDDRPTNELIYGQSHLDTDFVVPMEAIKQVEIVRGPGSALYGTNAVFGVINVVTKNGSDVNGVEAKLTGGTQYTGQINVLAGTVAGGWDLLADFNLYNTQGDQSIHFDDVHDAAHNFGEIDNSDHEGAYDGFFKAKRGELTAEIDFMDRQRDNRDATYISSFFDPGEMFEERENAMVRIDHPIDADKSFHAMVYFGRYNYFQNLPYATTATGLPTYTYTTTGNDAWLGQNVYFDDQVNQKLRWIAGAYGTESLAIRQRDEQNIPGPVPDIPSSYSAWALYAEAEYQVNPKLNLTVGVRVDNVQRLDTNVSPRFAAIYTPDKQDAFKALYGRAFRDPNLYELQYFAVGQQTPNANLKPEIVDTYELVWERQYKDGWSSSLDGYFWGLSNAMNDVVLGDGSVQTQNVGTTTAKGIEAEIDRRWDKRALFRFYGTYTWAQSEAGLPPESPKWTLGMALAAPLGKPGTYIAVEPQIVGPMKSVEGMNTQATYITNVVFTSDDFLKGWTFQAGVYGIFANNARFPGEGPTEQYQPFLDYPATQFRMSLSCRF